MLAHELAQQLYAQPNVKVVFACPDEGGELRDADEVEGVYCEPDIYQPDRNVVIVQIQP